jgi:sulfate adenylyltransferase
LIREAESLHSVLISSAAAANAVMLGSGYFNPLTGFMDKKDALTVAEHMRTAGGLFWPVPILNLLPASQKIPASGRIALRDPNVDGNPVLAVQNIESVEEMTAEEKKRITENIFATTDEEHPGVKTFLSQGNVIVSGPIRVLNFSYFESDFRETFRTAYQIRDEIKDAGWQKVVAFQTRNPMHRAHEELCKMAKEAVGADGILIHMLLGKLKVGDIPADVRDASIRKMVELYFPPNTVLITGYGFDMLYAGPKEAVLHAIFRQNCGCTHLIVGRDHAGVGSYYGPFDAQKIFDEQVPAGALEIEIFKADHTAWSKKLNRVVMMNSVTDHSKEDWVFLSGTRVREMLSRGEPLPVEFSRPEVAEILGKYYRSLS